MSLFGTRPPFLLRYSNPKGEPRYLARVGFQRFTPTPDITEAKLMERDEADFWAPLLRQWFARTFATLEICDSAGVGEPPGFERAVLHSECASLRQERDEARAQRDELRAAGRALVADLENPKGDLTVPCEHSTCNRLAMLNDGDQVACDEHRGMLVDGDIEDCSYAPALRRLRELTKEGA